MTPRHKGREGGHSGDKADTVTNKKGDKIGDKGRQEGDKADTVTNRGGGHAVPQQGRHP